MIYSEEGPQQGDPMGPLIFSLAIHPILETMKSSLIIGYLDDLTAGGEQQAVVSDYLTLQRMAGWNWTWPSARSSQMTRWALTVPLAASTHWVLVREPCWVPRSWMVQQWTMLWSLGALTWVELWTGFLSSVHMTGWSYSRTPYLPLSSCTPWGVHLHSGIACWTDSTRI